MSIYPHPFSKQYWRDALEDFRRPRTLTFAALMVAVCVALAYIPSIPITDGLRVTWGFLARALCAMVGGPITALVFAAVEDTLSFFLGGGGMYFPGYTLTTMTGCLIYALFLYRAKVTVVRIFLAKLLTNLQNVFVGTLWASILAKNMGGYWVRVSTSAVKNALMLPIQTIMLVALFAALLPVLKRMNLISGESGGRLTLK